MKLRTSFPAPICFFAITIIAALALAIVLRAADILPSASIGGTVKIQGQVPKAAAINMSADPSCAKLHPGGAVNEEVERGAAGGLGNVIVFVSEGLGDRAFDAPARPAVLEQKGCMYAPRVLAMQTSQKLVVKNGDQTLHNIHPLPTNNREWNRAETPGASVEAEFPREEIAIPVKCNVHPWMRGYIAVFKHPFFAVTGKNGEFDLKNLPPGNYTISAWHEKLGMATQKVTVEPGEAKAIEFVFKAH